MPFVGFADLYPELAARETRLIHVLREADSLPQGSYALVESYCDEVDCDCRRVMLQVHSPERGRFEAVIAYGWETRSFYAEWLGQDDPVLLDALQGPELNLGSPETEYSRALLEKVGELLRVDRAYVDRLKRHYAMMSAKIGRGLPARHGQRRVARNAPCPCESGRKFKNCCAEA